MAKTMTPAPKPENKAYRRDVELARAHLATQTMAMEHLSNDIAEAEALSAQRPQRYSSLCAAYSTQYAAVCKAAATLDRLEGMARDDGYWEERARDLIEQFTEAYGDRGPQYEVLIKRLVFAEISVEQLERSGRNFETAEWRSANKAVLDAIQALQKYPESQKSEMIQTAQQRAMLVIMEIAERVIAPKYPEAWARVVEEIERQLPAGESYE
jgi:hypothetical protein